MGMKLLFADYCSAEEHAQKESNPKSWLTILAEQCINSAIVAGIVAIASWGEWEVALKSFIMVFLFEMRKYRKLK